MNDNKMITQSRIIEEYGWTKSLISKFLPDPVLKANPHYRKAAPMRLWTDATPSTDIDIYFSVCLKVPLHIYVMESQSLYQV